MSQSGTERVTLTPDERHILAVARHGRLALTDEQLAAVEQIVAARVKAALAEPEPREDDGAWCRDCGVVVSKWHEHV